MTVTVANVLSWRIVMVEQLAGSRACDGTPKLDWADRAVLAALTRLLPRSPRMSQLVRRSLKRLRIPPAPQRDRTAWRQFLRRQAVTGLGLDGSK